MFLQVRLENGELFASSSPHQVTFSSLDVHLHTEALLNTMNFLENLLPQTPRKGDGQEELLTIPKTDEGKKDGDMKEEVVVAKKKSKNKKSFSV